MIETERPCAWCGHAERWHHPTRTETWCIVGIATDTPCECPGYNPNSELRVRAWLSAHDARVRAEQREADAKIVERFGGPDVRDGAWLPSGLAARAIREGGNA